MHQVGAAGLAVSGVSFGFRYQVFEAHKPGPGPSFELVLVELDDSSIAMKTHVLYKSSAFESAPYGDDVDRHNFSPPIFVAEKLNISKLGGIKQQVRIVFRNTEQRLCLHGARYDGKHCACELDLSLYFGDGAKVPLAPSSPPGNGVLRYGSYVLLQNKKCKWFLSCPQKHYRESPLRWTVVRKGAGDWFQVLHTEESAHESNVGDVVMDGACIRLETALSLWELTCSDTQINGKPTGTCMHSGKKGVHSGEKNQWRVQYEATASCEGHMRSGCIFRLHHTASKQWLCADGSLNKHADNHGEVFLQADADEASLWEVENWQQPSASHGLPTYKPDPQTAKSSWAVSQSNPHVAIQKPQNKQSFWECDTAGPVTIEVVFSGPTPVNAYSLSLGSVGGILQRSAPTAWILEGTVDGSTWDLLHRVDAPRYSVDFHFRDAWHLHYPFDTTFELTRVQPTQNTEFDAHIESPLFNCYDDQVRACC
jgi:hypothetical protein